MENKKQNVGEQGENEACFFLQNEGHRIVARNWRNEHRELDIVSLKQGAIHIVEVKTRTAPVTAPPEISVNLAKRTKLVAAAKAFLHSAEFKALHLDDAELFFDVITVVLEATGPIIEYYPKAFIPIYV